MKTFINIAHTLKNMVCSTVCVPYCNTPYASQFKKLKLRLRQRSVATYM